MLRPWLSSGAGRVLCRSIHRPLLVRPYNCRFSSVASSFNSSSADRVPLRKQLKQEAKALKAQKKQRRESEEASRQDWELTVGVEIHAQLDAGAKLFSRRALTVPATNRALLTFYLGAPTSTSETPNSNVALFDLAFPGSQPVRLDEIVDEKDWDSCDTGIPSCHPPPGPSRGHCSQL